MKLYKSLTLALKDREEVRALKLTLKNDFPDISIFPNLEELYLDGEINEVPDLKTTKVKILSLRSPGKELSLSHIFNAPYLENLKIIETPFKQFHLPLGHSLSPLKFLTIKDCDLSDLPEEISMLGHLQEINLSGNTLTKLPYSFRDLVKLKRLNLDKNKFSVFPDLVKKMPALFHLSIDGNNFSEEEIERIQRDFHIFPN